MKREELLDLITITEAGRLRGVSHQAIIDLIKRGKLTPVEVGGRKFLRRTDVLNDEPSKGGRPAKQSAETTRRLNTAFKKAVESEQKAGKKKATARGSRTTKGAGR